MTATRLDKLLRNSAGGKLDKIIQRAQNMESLTTTLRTALPADAADNLLAANLREDGQIVLICATSAWASRIRFESDQLLVAARATGIAAHGCVVTVGRPLPGDNPQA